MERPWVKNYPDSVQADVDFPNVPAYHFLFEHVKKHPDWTALIFFEKKMSYGDLGAAIDAFAQALIRRLGIQKGDRVGIMLPNCPQNVIATYGAMRAGAVPVQFNPLYVSREIKYQLEDSGSKVLLTLDLFWEKVKVAGVPGVQYVQTSVADYLPFPLNFLYPLKAKPPKVPVDQAVHFRDLMREKAVGYMPVAVDPQEDLAVLLYTGGTTGVSKGVMLTHANITANLTQISSWLMLPEAPNYKVLCILPMFHSFGFTAVVGSTLAAGRAAILVPRFDAVETLKLLKKHQPKIFPGIPTLYTALLNHPHFAKYPFKTDLCITGAAPMPVELMKQFEQASGASILEGYGLTETSPVTHSNPVKGNRKPGSVGLPYPGTDVRIINLETGEDVPIGEEGEVLIKGPQVMKGYWNKPDETAATIKDGWLFTGDIGRMDEDGYLFLIDRKKDMIISSGFNVYPREIDEVVYQHPAVQEACAIGVPDEYRGESAKVFVVLKSGTSATEKEIIDFCRERLAAYKRPREVEFLPELPKSVVGKVLRRELVKREREKAQRTTTSSVV